MQRWSKRRRTSWRRA